MTLDLMAKHSLDFWLTSEDLPDPNNRVTLDRDGGMQWPVTDAASTGTRILHADGFVRGLGKFILTRYVPTDEQANRRYPLILTTGRILSQYNVGTQTRRTANVMWHARDVLEALGYSNVWVRVANGTLGWPDEAPFDRILVTAGGPSVPPPLFEQLAEGGWMVMPVGEATTQVLQVIEKRGGEMRTTPHAGCVFVKLVGKFAWES